MYTPPFTISNTMLNLSISVTEKIGKISHYESLKRMPVLRRNNKIKSIHSSLVIEASSLSLDQVRDVINGRMVLGPEREIQEVKNAYQAYEQIEDFDGYNEKDLLKAHAILMNKINDDAGNYRNHGEGVFNGNQIIFVAPPENLIKDLMKNLFEWLNEDNGTPILIKSCIFHYEFVFIHPFSDGNGRLARLWQNVLLTKWNPLFEYLTIESQIKEYQDEYYNVIATCYQKGNSNLFIEFMLKVINETLDDTIKNIERESKNISDQVNKLLNVMEPDIPLSANEIMNRLGIKSKETLRSSYINPAIENGLIHMTLPDKPNSKNQKYIK